MKVCFLQNSQKKKMPDVEDSIEDFDFRRNHFKRLATEALVGARGKITVFYPG